MGRAACERRALGLPRIFCPLNYYFEAFLRLNLLIFTEVGPYVWRLFVGVGGWDFGACTLNLGPCTSLGVYAARRVPTTSGARPWTPCHGARASDLEPRTLDLGLLVGAD